MNSRWVDWTEEKWEFVGRNVMEERLGEWSKDNENGIQEDDGYPIMNFAYPIDCGTPYDDRIFRVCDETCCTVVYNNVEDCYYLALTGGGMNLSQSIALAYMIVNAGSEEEYGIVDWSMIDEVYISERLSIGKRQYQILLETLKRQYQTSILRAENTIKTINEQLRGRQP